MALFEGKYLQVVNVIVTEYLLSGPLRWLIRTRMY